jgi:hypothetical protein
VYPDALACHGDGPWWVIRWDEIERYVGQSLTSPLFARLALHGGHTITLENNYSNPSSLYHEIERRVNALRVARADGDRRLEMSTFDRPVPHARRSPKHATPALAAGGVVLVLLGVGLFPMQWRWLRWVVEGPVSMSGAQLVKLQNAEEVGNPMVSVKCDRYLDTNIEVTATRKGNTTTESRFVLALVQDRWLIANVPLNFHDNRLVGYLGAWGPRGAASTDAIAKVTANFPECKDALLSFQLDATYRARMEWISFFCVDVLLVVGGAAMLVVASRRRHGQQP